MTGKWRACGSVVTLWPSTKQALGNHLILPQSIDNFIVDGAQGWEALQGNFMDHEHYCACVAKIPDTDPERVGLGIATNWRNRTRAAALSVLIVDSLDRKYEIEDENLASFCFAAAAKRPGG